MNVRDLLDVGVICETGSLRKAATVLGITQPTLGNRIAHLEDQLGAPLFDRSRGQSRPTDLALFIAGRAASLSDDAKRLTREIRRVATGNTGLVRIGLGPTPTRLLLASIVADINERWPGISLEMVSGYTAQLAEALLQRELDLLVCPPMDVRHDAIASEPLLETDIVVVVGADHPMQSRPATGHRWTLQVSDCDPVPGDPLPGPAARRLRHRPGRSGRTDRVFRLRDAGAGGGEQLSPVHRRTSHCVHRRTCRGTPAHREYRRAVQPRHSIAYQPGCVSPACRDTGDGTSSSRHSPTSARRRAGRA